MVNAIILFVAFLAVFALGFFWGIHDCKKIYGIPRGLSPDEVLMRWSIVHDNT